MDVQLIQSLMCNIFNTIKGDFRDLFFYKTKKKNKSVLVHK